MAAASNNFMNNPSASAMTAAAAAAAMNVAMPHPMIQVGTCLILAILRSLEY